METQNFYVSFEVELLLWETSVFACKALNCLGEADPEAGGSST